jgi:hypothetical protein
MIGQHIIIGQSSFTITIATRMIATRMPNLLKNTMYS